MIGGRGAGILFIDQSTKLTAIDIIPYATLIGIPILILILMYHGEQ